MDSPQSTTSNYSRVSKAPGSTKMNWFYVWEYWSTRISVWRTLQYIGRVGESTTRRSSADL